MIPTEILHTPETVNGVHKPVTPPWPLWPEVNSSAVVQPEGEFGQVIAGSPNGPFIQFMAITPQIAHEILTVNPNPDNRKISSRRVATYARLMREGKWNITHQGIAFRGAFGDSTLDDGQHRLRAIVESGTTQIFAVSTFMTHFETADIGKARSVSDVLTMAKFTNSTYLGGAIRFIQAYDKTSRPWKLTKEDFTHAEFIEFAGVMSDDIAPLIHYARGTVSRLSKGSPTAILAGLYIIDRWAKRNADVMEKKNLDLKAWLDGLKHGTGLEKRDPRLALCNWIVNSSKFYHATVASDLTMLSTIRVFYAWCEGKQLNNLYFPDPNNYMFRLPGDVPTLAPKE